MVEKRKKILFLVTEDWYFCSHRLDLAKAVKSQGHEVVVVTQVNHHADDIIQAGLKLTPLKFNRSVSHPLQDLKTLFHLYSIYRREKPDIVHHVALKPVIYGSLVELSARLWSDKQTAVVNALTGLGYAFSSTDTKASIIRAFISPVLKFILKQKHAQVILQNNDDAQLIKNLGLLETDSANLIRGSGVDTSIYYPGEEQKGDITVILAARMLKDKGVMEFVEAAGTLKRKALSLRMILVGGVDDANPSRVSLDLLQQWQQEGVVEWWGKRTDMVDIFRHAHIVCLPSYREGLPKVLLEAAACAKPLVATDVPGCREIVRDGYNGFLVPKNNALKLAEAIEKLALNKDMRLAFGKNSRKMVEQSFSVDIVVDKTLALYKKLLDQRKKT